MDADVLLGQEEDEETMNAAMAASTAGSAMAAAAREYRRGNWTLPETMLLVEAKKRVSDGRRPAADQGLARWRWVEDYCWRRGCRRSQNQCNDRWDNLMRDYKKVRAHELAAAGGGGGGGPAESYWVMGRTERKEKGLPANLLREIYDAMGEVVERRPMSSGGGGGGAVFLAGASSSGSGGLADCHLSCADGHFCTVAWLTRGDGELQLGVAGEEEEAAVAGQRATGGQHATSDDRKAGSPRTRRRRRRVRSSWRRRELRRRRRPGRRDRAVRRDPVGGAGEPRGLGGAAAQGGGGRGGAARAGAAGAARGRRAVHGRARHRREPARRLHARARRQAPGPRRSQVSSTITHACTRIRSRRHAMRSRRRVGDACEWLACLAAVFSWNLAGRLG
ncbi:Os03g0666300 [Oryza sativa Japonica Group]|uniref:Os03g0666300 protein n=1 Tax=Oryza sativa subsp. japonica TaxID=39947 RepID=A0A0P0W1V1_ORYSJ|nr:hypothetical protein EE612_019506 [Oryza sativa]BAS85639.1 Os03g0666300 [Oryza sativa Japonica Group]